jgi:hypothetical protein
MQSGAALLRSQECDRFRAAVSARESLNMRPRSTTMARVTSSMDVRDVRDRVDTGSGRL